jgi:hypothetical protein
MILKQQEKKIEKVIPLSGHFRVVPESFTKMVSNVKRCDLNLCQSVLELDIEETQEFAVLNWVAGLANEDLKKEIITVMALDSKGDILCMLRLLNLTLLDHETSFLKGNDTPLFHTVSLKFDVIERVNKKPTFGG